MKNQELYARFCGVMFSNPPLFVFNVGLFYKKNNMHFFYNISICFMNLTRSSNHFLRWNNFPVNAELMLIIIKTLCSRNNIFQVGLTSIFNWFFCDFCSQSFQHFTASKKEAFIALNTDSVPETETHFENLWMAFDIDFFIVVSRCGTGFSTIVFSI